MAINAKSHPIKKACAAIAGVFALSVTSSAFAAEPSLSDDEIGKALNMSYSEMNLSASAAPYVAVVITVNNLDFASDDGGVCKHQVPGSEQDRNAILASRDYQLVDTPCSRDGRFNILVDQGLIEGEELSPYVWRYKLTDLGVDNVTIDEAHGRYQYYFYYVDSALENILEKRLSHNPYNIPVAQVRYSAVPKLADWAVGAPQLESLVDRMKRGRRARAQYSAELWKTDNGWDLFDLNQE